MGSINLKHTGSGSAIALSSDGTSLLLDGTAIGGGGADLYAANESSPSAQPSATGANAIAIGDSAVSTGTDTVALGKSRAGGTSSFAVGNNLNTTSYGSIGANSIAIGAYAKAVGERSIMIGKQGVAQGVDSVLLGKGGGTGTAATEGVGIMGGNVQAYRGMAFGSSSSVNANHSNSIALGVSVSSTAANQVNIGSDAQDVRISEVYTLPKVDGTASGQVLTTDGSGTVSWAAAGGGADLYAANESNPSAQPSATGDNAIAIGDGAIASGLRSIVLGYGQSSGTEGVSIGVDNNSTNFGAKGVNSIAMGKLAVASNTSCVAIGQSASASTNNSIALGVSSVAAGLRATALTNSYASGEDSFAAAIANNTSSYGALRANNIAMGQNAKADSSTGGGVAIGSNTIANSRETVAIGSAAYADGSGSVALGGYFGTSIQARATGNASFAVAGYNGFGSIDSTAAGLGSIAMGGGHADQDQSKAFGAYAHSNVRGKVAWSAYSLQSQHGTTQAGNYVLINATTNATGTVLVTDYQLTSPSAINQVVLPNNSCYGFTGTVIAREAASATNDFAVWEIKGGAVRAGSASTTALGTYNINKISESTGATNWSIALSADTTNGAVAITVTGEASHNIRWVATVNTSEVINA
jgi:hypothetical protein